MITDIRTKYSISDEKALHIRRVLGEKLADTAIATTKLAHRDDRIFLDGADRGQVNGESRMYYNGLARDEELADPKYMVAGKIFSTSWR